MGRVCGHLKEVVTFENLPTGGPFLVMGLQGVKTMENHKTASPTSRHGCLHKEVTYERFLSLGFEWENFGVLHRWSLTRVGRTWRLACNRVLQERVITLSPTSNLEAQGITLRVGLYPSTFLAWVALPAPHECYRLPQVPWVWIPSLFLPSETRTWSDH